MILLKNIKNNPKNPRIIKNDKFKKLVKSIQDFPKMMELRPMIVDENDIVLGGNMRLKALQELKYKEIPDEWIKKASELTEEQKKEFIIKDNNSFGEWDFEFLANEYELPELEDWGLKDKDLMGFDNNLELIDQDMLRALFNITIKCETKEEQTDIMNKFKLKKPSILAKDILCE